MVNVAMIKNEASANCKTTSDLLQVIFTAQD